MGIIRTAPQSANVLPPRPHRNVAGQRQKQYNGLKEVIGDRIASICASHDVTVDYAFQDINDIPGTLPEDRTKPWGTGQAVLAAKNVIKTPFIVINADDYYGKEGFKADLFSDL